MESDVRVQGGPGAPAALRTLIEIELPSLVVGQMLSLFRSGS